jgi:uncharacterized protein YbjT (DUF2867 family)
MTKLPFWPKQSDIRLNLFFLVDATLHQQIKTEKMNIVLTGSIGNVRKPLAQELIKRGHSVTVISSSAERKIAIEALGAKAAMGGMLDADFLTETFKGADIVYLMVTMEAAGDMFDKSVDFFDNINKIGDNYRKAVEQSSVKKLVNLGSIAAHTHIGTGILMFHYNVESLLRKLAEDVDIKFIRPGSFFINL